jgi:hypothetical protein
MPGRRSALNFSPRLTAFRTKSIFAPHWVAKPTGITEHLLSGSHIMSNTISILSDSPSSKDPNLDPYTNPHPEPGKDPNVDPYKNPHPDLDADPNLEPYENPHPEPVQDPNLDPYTER